MTGWFILYSAIALSLVGTALLKMADGLEHKYHLIAGLTIFTVVNIAYSYTLKFLPMGIVAAIWSGLGITLITVMGWLFFKEQLTIVQLTWIGVILIGCIGLNLATVK